MSENNSEAKDTNEVIRQVDEAVADHVGDHAGRLKVKLQLRSHCSCNVFLKGHWPK